MDRGRHPWVPPVPCYGRPPYWNPNQQPPPYYGLNPYPNQGASFSNVDWNPVAQHSSYNFPRPLARPRLPHSQRARFSLGPPSLNSQGQHRGRNLDLDRGKGVLGPDGPSVQRVKTSFLPPKKRAEFKSPELYRQHCSGSDGSSSESAAEKPMEDPVEEVPPVSDSPKMTGLGSDVAVAVSAAPLLKSSDSSMSITQTNDQGDVLGLGGYIEKKRMLSKNSLADVEEEVKDVRKKTRLGWGQGLAKYEKQLKDQNAQNLVADGDNGGSGSSIMTNNKAIICTATAFCHGPSPPPGSNLDLGNDHTNTMVHQIVVPASSQGCCALIGDIGYRWNSRTSLTGTVIHPPELSDLPRKHIPPPEVRGNSGPCNSSSNMAEAIVCTATVPASSNKPSLSLGDIDDRGNISTSWTETVVCPEAPASSYNPLPAVGGNSDPCNSNSSMAQAVVYDLAAPHGCDLPPAGGGDSNLSNSSVGMMEAMACPAATSHGYDLPSENVSFERFTEDQARQLEEEFEFFAEEGATGVHGNNNLSMTETVVGPTDVRASPRAGDNFALGNDITSLTATVVNVDTSCEGCNLPPDCSNTKSTKVQDSPQKLISQPSSKIQKSTRMPQIIHSKLQKPKEFLKKNILFEEPQDNELQGSTFKAWLEEEKGVFQENITTLGMDFTKISSFLLHKAPIDCIENYSKHYKSECFTKANKCLPSMKQSQEKSKNVIDAAPNMAGIATATATKNYKRTKAVAEDMNKPTKQICHKSMAHLQSDNLPDKGHQVESSMEKYEYVSGNESVGEMNAPSLHGMNCPFTNYGKVVCTTIPETEVFELKNLNEDCSNEEINKGEQEISANMKRCLLIEAIESHGMDECKNLLRNCKNDLKIGKKHVNSNINSTNGTNDKLVSNMDSVTCIIKSYSKVKENVSQPVMDADHGDIENYVAGGSNRHGTLERMSLPEICTIEGDQISSGEENPELCSALEECSPAAEHSSNDKATNKNINDDSKSLSDMKNPGSGNNPCSDTNGPELSGHDDFEKPPEDSEGLKISSKENDDKAKRDEKNPHHCVASEESCRIELDCIVNSQKGKEDIGISSPEVSDLNVPPMLDSDEASKNSHLSSSSGSAALQTVYAKSSGVDVGIDLNIPPDPSLPDVASEVIENNHAEASIDLNEPCQTTDAAVIMGHEPGIRERATTDLGGDSEAENDLTHVQAVNQSPTTVPETSHQPANQHGCVMLFGQIIYQVPSLGTNLTSSQVNEIVLHSRDMPSNTVVPLIARGGQVHASIPDILRCAPVNLGQQAILPNTTMPYGSSNAGPSLWRSAPVNPDEQAVLPNTMFYGLSNAVAARPPLQPESSSLINMSQQRHHVNMMPYSMLRAGVPYHWRPGSSSGSGLINFNDFNPGQQHWPSSILDMDTSRTLIGYPHLPGSTRNQAPTAIMPSTTNIDGTSTSNTRFPAAGRGRGGRGRSRGRRRGRAHNV